jgi:hypothetical protein
LWDTRDDWLNLKSALLIKWAADYANTHYLSITWSTDSVLFTVAPSGHVWIGLWWSEATVNTPTSSLDIDWDNWYTQLRLRDSYTPTWSADVNWAVGDFARDDGFVYVKVSTWWKRSALTAF